MASVIRDDQPMGVDSSRRRPTRWGIGMSGTAATPGAAPSTPPGGFGVASASSVSAARSFLSGLTMHQPHQPNPNETHNSVPARLPVAPTSAPQGIMYPWPVPMMPTPALPTFAALAPGATVPVAATKTSTNSATISSKPANEASTVFVVALLRLFSPIDRVPASELGVSMFCEKVGVDPLWDAFSRAMGEHHSESEVFPLVSSATTKTRLDERSAAYPARTKVVPKEFLPNTEMAGRETPARAFCAWMGDIAKYEPTAEKKETLAKHGFTHVGAFGHLSFQSPVPTLNQTTFQWTRPAHPSPSQDVKGAMASVGPANALVANGDIRTVWEFNDGARRFQVQEAFAEVSKQFPLIDTSRPFSFEFSPPRTLGSCGTPLSCEPTYFWYSIHILAKCRTFSEANSIRLAHLGSHPSNQDSMSSRIFAIKSLS